MKNTMNKSDIARFHKLLADEVKPSECSKILKVSPATLKKFTPEAVKKAKEASAARAAKAAEKSKKSGKAAAVLAEAAKKATEGE